MLLIRVGGTYQPASANASGLTYLWDGRTTPNRAPMIAEQIQSTDGQVLQAITAMATGRSFELAKATDEAGDTVVLRSLRTADPVDLSEAGAVELAALAVDSERLPRAGRAFSVDGPRGLENLVVYRWVPGKTLSTWIAEEHREGLPPGLLVRFLSDVAEALSALHRAGIVHRCLTPEHVIIDESGRATLVGLGNATLKAGPPPANKTSVDEAFSAPETINERSGRFNTPRADVYGFGLLASFAATAQRPTGSVHAPLTKVASERLEAQPEGVSLLIAKCLQPLQKNRIASMRQILPLLEEVEALPTPTTPGFGPLVMLAPWFNDDDPGALRVGHLSPGPLVDRPKPAAPQKVEPKPDESAIPPQPPVLTQIEPVGLAPMSIVISAVIAIATIYMVARALLSL